MRFVIATILNIVLLSVLVCLVYLVIKALRTYIKSKDVREEKAKAARTLGEVLRSHRLECKMTQEFVAEAIGVSRQAVSKWESGAADPSTTNLIAVAKLFKISPEDLLRETQKQSEE